MERASRVLGKLGAASDEQLAQAAWPLAVGRRLAARTGPVTLCGSRLVVSVEDAVWQSQLYSLREHILANLERSLGRRIVTALEFRVALPRPRPQPETQPRASADEAESIADSMMRNVYRAARKRANH